LLEEIDERAESLYSEIWKSCTDLEKLELRHIAQFGLANPANSRAVRQLIMKRLVTKDPNFRVMNRTFQRFVVSPQSGGQLAQADVARIEGELGASVWDQFRAPFALAVTGVAAFLFLTQRETYNTTVGAMVGLATQVPNILKTLTTMVYKDSSGLPGQRV
jgi:tRNA U34 5-methylaminomethyl-2-thiouridine-forming methyltransferase MnmC